MSKLNREKLIVAALFTIKVVRFIVHYASFGIVAAALWNHWIWVALGTIIAHDLLMIALKWAANRIARLHPLYFLIKLADYIKNAAPDPRQPQPQAASAADWQITDDDIRPTRPN